MTAAQPIQIALRVGAALEALGVAYHLGGSLASSIHGEPRATNDIDMVVDLQASQVSAFIAALGPDFAVDRESLVDAVHRRDSCNIFFLPFFTKVDLFVARTGPFDRAELARGRRITVDDGGSLIVKSPEDTVLRKLLWFRAGGEVSDRQWRDVVQVLRLNLGALDEAVFDEWAVVLRVDDLLSKARDAARIGDGSGR